MRRVFLIGVWCLLVGGVHAQTAYSILIRGGHVIDPKNKIDGVMDVGINEGRIIKIEKNIKAEATQVVDATGLLVAPGLIDMHTHVFYGSEPEHSYGNGPLAIVPDGFTFRTGVTTVVDAGSSGWRSFPTFKSQIIDHSQTRVLAFINIVGEGMRGGVYEQDTSDMSGKMTALVAQRYKDIIVGVKVAHFVGAEWTPVDQAVRAGNIAHIPVMIDFGGATPALSIESLFMQHLRPGDIFTHCFGQLSTREPIVDPVAKRVKPFVWEARKKGINFDVGFGEISFAFSQAKVAAAEAFWPNSISSDIHTGSMNGAMKDMLNIMSNFLALGMPIDSVIAASTWHPAVEVHHEELGSLSIGGIADVTLLNVRLGKFGFFDYTGAKVLGDRRLECAMTIKGGTIVYDLNGIATPVTLRVIK